MAKMIEPIDLDMELDLAKVYKDALETIDYLQNVVDAISARVLDGEEIKGLAIVEGRKTRFITEEGLEYIEKTLGKDVAYQTITKPITITDLERKISKKSMAYLEANGYIEYRNGKLKVINK